MALNQYEDMILNDKEETIQATPISPPVPKYEAVVQEDNKMQVSSIAQSMNYAAEKEPSRMERAIKMAQEMGLDVPTVERNLETIQKKRAVTDVDYESIVRDNPGTAKFLETPENAALAKDDLEPIRRFDKSIQFMPKKQEDSTMKKFGLDMYQAGETGWNQMTANMAAVVVAEGMGGREWIEAQAIMNKRAKDLSDKRPDYAKEFQRVMQEEAGDVSKGLDKLKTSYKQWTNGEKLKAMKSFVEGDIETVAELIDVMREAVWGPERLKGLLYSAGESLTASVPAVGLGTAGLATGPGAVVAVPAGVFAGSAVVETGSTINALLEAKGIDTTDADALENAYKDTQLMSDIRAQARRKGLTTAAVEAAVSAFGGHFAAKLGKAPTTITKKVAARAADTGVEMSGETLGQIGGEIAQNKGDMSKVDIAGAIQEGVMSLGTSFIQAGQSAAVKGEFAARRALYDKDPLVAAEQVIADTDKAQTAIQSAQKLQEVGAALKETKNLKNIPEKVSELVEAATGGQGASAVYFQTDDFDGYWSKKGVNPLDKAAEIMGDNGKAYQDARNTGGVFEVPLEKFAATIGTTEDFEGMLPVTRTAPDAMSLSEAQEHLSALPTMVQQVATEATNAQSIVEPVEQAIQKRTSLLRDEIQDSLVNAGRPVREAKYAAQQVEAFFKTTAQKFGMNLEQLEDFIVKYKPTINQGQMVGEGQTFNQVGTTMQASGPQVSPLGFYSQVEAEVQKMDFKTMPGKDLSGRIKNIAGIKKEELEFLGLNEWLETQEGKVSKEDVVNFIRNQGLVVDQIVLSEDYTDEFSVEDSEIEWSEPERDHSSDDDDIYNEKQYYLKDYEEWITENTAEIRTDKLEEFTDEDGVVDEAGLQEAIEEELEDRAEKAATEAVESDDWGSARYDVRLDVDGETFYMSGSDELGWYSSDVREDLGYDLNEAKIKLLAALNEAGKITINESALRRPEDLSWKSVRAKTPSEATIKKKMKELINRDRERLMKKAREEFPNEYKDISEEEIAKTDENNLEYLSRQEVLESYQNPNDKKNELSYFIDHPMVTGKITGNNVKGWKLDVDGDKEGTRDGGTITTGSLSVELSSKDIEAAKEEALKVMIENKVLLAPKEKGSDVNQPSGSSKFDRYIKEGEATNYREFLLTLPKNEESFVYSGHFSQKNVVAHARVTDRVDADGKKVLFIEEIQSDWHQQGREKGYKGSFTGKDVERQADVISEINDARAKWDADKAVLTEPLYAEMKEIESLGPPESLPRLKQNKAGLWAWFEGGEQISGAFQSMDEADSEVARSTIKIPENTRRWMRRTELQRQIDKIEGDFDSFGDVVNHLEKNNYITSELASEYRDLNSRESAMKDAVADAPLKNTEAWAGLVLKRMIRLAVEQGYDSVSWSPASFQVERWGTDDITWVKKEASFDIIGPDSKKPMESFKTREEAQARIDAAPFPSAFKIQENPAYFLVGSTEQRGGQADGMDIEELARMRGQLLERKGEKITTKEELMTVVKDTLGRQRSQKDLENLTNNIWEQMQIKETGQKAPRKEGMESFYDKMIPKVAQTIIKKMDKDAKVVVTKIKTQSMRSEPIYVGPDFTLQQINEFRDKALNDENAPVSVVRDLKDLAEAMRDNSDGRRPFSELANINLSSMTAEYIGAKKAYDESKAFSQVLSIPITDTLKQKAMEGFALFQGDPNTPLGRITFGETGINIDLLQNANPSTFMHEMAHAYLKIMMDLQAGENVPQNVRDDFSKILGFLEVDSAEKIGVEQHEKFARGFEAYLREGRAPSEGLRKAFANFKAWLLTVYKNLTQLRVELNDDIRGVFDRMLATEEEITQAKNKITGEWDMQKLDVSTEKQMEYLVAVSEWQTKAEESLMAKIMGDYERQKQAEYREKRKEVEQGFEKIANEMLVYRAISLMRDGTRPDGSQLPDGVVPFKLERSSIEKRFSKELVSRLPARIVSPVKKGGGMNVDLAAGQLGFEDADQMIQMLVGTPKKEDFIKMQTDAEMKKLYPEVYEEDHETLKAEAMEYVHDELGSKVKRMQFEMIAEKAMPTLKEGIRQVTRRLPSNRQIRAQAEKVIGSMKSKDIRPVVFLRAERKAAKEAGVLLARGDFEGAFKAKERELYNFELYRASVEWNDQYKGALNNFKKIYKSDEKMAKVRDMDLVNAARAILAQYGIGKKNKSPEDYLEKMKAYDPDTYETISQLVEASLVQASSLDEMTADDFIAVRDAVFAIWDLSKTSMEHIVDGQALNRQDVIDGLNARIGEVAKTQERIGFDQKATWQQEMKVRFLGVKAALRRVEHWTEGMGGTFKKMIHTPISDATNKYREERKKFIKKYRDLTVDYANKSTGIFDDKIIDAPELVRTDADGVQRSPRLTKREIVGAILHTGNESNKKKLLAGRKWGTVNDDGTMNSAQWDKFIDRLHKEGILTKADWDYVQSLWDLMEEMKPAAQMAHKQMYGYYFNEVTAQSVSTPFGNYRGGYAPAVADPFISEDGRIRNDKEALEKMNNTFMFPTTGRGFTKKRVENYSTPLSIDLSLVGQHIDKVMRFTHIEPSVKSVSRIVMNKDFRYALTAYDQTVGSELLVPWLQRSAQQRVSTPGSNRAADAFFTTIRARAGMNAMFMNITNALQQITGWSVSLLKVKPRYLRNAMWTYMRSPSKASQVVSEKSSFMAARLDKEMQQIMRDLDEILTSETVFKKTQEAAKKHAYVLQSGFQNVVDVTTWMGAYDQAIEAGLQEKDAVREADGAVRTTQGSLNAEDVSRFETGTPFVRVFTMFASYFNTLANTLTTEAYSKNIRDLGLKKGMGRALYVYFFGFAVPAVMSELIVKAMQGSDFDEDDDDQYMDDFMMIFFGSQFRTATAMIPVAGQLANVAMGQFDDMTYNDRINTSPAISTLESAVTGNAKNLYQAVFTDKDTNKKKVARDFLSALGLLTGIPTGQIGKTAGYMIDVSEGNVNPETPVEAVQGAITGRTPR